jgi:hypothetical protein
VRLSLWRTSGLHPEFNKVNGCEGNYGNDITSYLVIESERKRNTSLNLRFSLIGSNEDIEKMS